MKEIEITVKQKDKKSVEFLFPDDAPFCAIVPTMNALEFVTKENAESEPFKIKFVGDIDILREYWNIDVNG